MHIAPMMAAIQAHVSIPESGTVNALMLVRWVHFLAGITWVGLLYFFNLVNVPFQKEMDAATRAKVVPLLMPRALWWFRWTSVVTVLAGITYWMNIVSSDAHNANASSGRAIWTFFVIWTVAFVIEMGLLMSPAEGLRKGPVFGTISGIVVVAAAYLYLWINSDGWESNRLLSIGIGGGIGWFMMLNVWGLIWRMQKKIIRWTRENPTGAMPPELTRMARLTFLASRLNFVLSIPMLFFMGAASHYPLFGK
ncbi:MAG: urate hydroxylase PuuD [Terriglobales bacterium]